MSLDHKSGSAPAPHRATWADHFQRITRIPREEFFGRDDPRWLPLHLQDDARTMFAGYVGPNFKPGGVLVLAINPGGGTDKYRVRTLGDEQLYPLLERFKSSAGLAIPAAFEAINRAFPEIVRSWNLWRILEPTLTAAEAELEDIAYMNVVPYRTRQDKKPPRDARRRGWELVVEPTLTLLASGTLITLGKKADEVVAELNRSALPYFCIPRTIGDTYLSDDARVALEKLSLHCAIQSGQRRSRRGSR